MEAFLIERKKYLEQLITKRENRMIKIITGIRRCGKSFLLFTLYEQYLKSDEVAEEQIVTLALDNAFKRYCNGISGTQIFFLSE